MGDDESGRRVQDQKGTQDYRIERLVIHFKVSYRRLLQERKK